METKPFISWRRICRGSDDVYKAGLTNAHPPLFFLLLHFWIRLGDSEFFLRLLSRGPGDSLSLGSLSVGSDSGRRSAALAAVALLSFSPALVALSAEVRGLQPAALADDGCARPLRARRSKAFGACDGRLFGVSLPGPPDALFGVLRRAGAVRLWTRSFEIRRPPDPRPEHLGGLPGRCRGSLSVSRSDARRGSSRELPGAPRHDPHAAGRVLSGRSGQTARFSLPADGGGLPLPLRLGPGRGRRVRFCRCRPRRPRDQAQAFGSSPRRSRFS